MKGPCLQYEKNVVNIHLVIFRLLLKNWRQCSVSYIYSIDKQGKKSCLPVSPIFSFMDIVICENLVSHPVGMQTILSLDRLLIFAFSANSVPYKMKSYLWLFHTFVNRNKAIWIWELNNFEIDCINCGFVMNNFISIISVFCFIPFDVVGVIMNEEQVNFCIYCRRFVIENRSTPWFLYYLVGNFIFVISIFFIHV